MIKLARKPADDRAVARVRRPKSAAGESAQMLVGRDDDDGLAHLGDLNRRRNRGARSAVNDDVVGTDRFRPSGVGHKNRETKDDKRLPRESKYFRHEIVS